jgi:hypothetical protein
MIYMERKLFGRLKKKDGLGKKVPKPFLSDLI